MKTLVVYYSYSGNHRVLAENIARLLEADICPVVEITKRTKWRICLDILLRRKAKLRNLDRPLSKYQNLVFVAPLWGGQIATPMHTLLHDQKRLIKRFSFITLCEDIGCQEERPRLQKELKRITGKNPAYVYVVHLHELTPLKKRRSFKVISSHHDFEPTDLEKLSKELSTFTAHSEN